MHDLVGFAFWVLHDLVGFAFWFVAAFAFCWFFDVKITRRKK